MGVNPSCAGMMHFTVASSPQFVSALKALLAPAHEHLVLAAELQNLRASEFDRGVLSITDSFEQQRNRLDAENRELRRLRDEASVQLLCSLRREVTGRNVHP